MTADSEAAKNRKAVYEAMLSIVSWRDKKDRKKKIRVGQVVELVDLPGPVVSNVMRWLRTKGLISKVEKGEGWVLHLFRGKQAERYCWEHGLIKEVRGKGRKFKIVCPICERRRNPKSGKE